MKNYIRFLAITVSSLETSQASGKNPSLLTRHDSGVIFFSGGGGGEGNDTKV